MVSGSKIDHTIRHIYILSTPYFEEFNFAITNLTNLKFLSLVVSYLQPYIYQEQIRFLHPVYMEVR